jgi:fumarylpyruvate hydrolase
MAKGFDGSAPIGDLIAASRIGHPRDGLIELRVNGQVRQSGDIARMIWSPAEIVAELSRFVTLRPGDLIFTGTPAGVGPLQRGDAVDGRVVGVGVVRTRIV